MEMSWITAISQLYSQIINLFGNAILKLKHIRLFDLLTRCHYILNPPRSYSCCFESNLVGNPDIMFSHVEVFNLSRVMRKLDFCICENKGADQLCSSNHAADQRLCFRYIDSRLPLLPKPESLSLYPSSVLVQPGLCQTWSEARNAGFYVTWLILLQVFTCED